MNLKKLEKSILLFNDELKSQNLADIDWLYAKQRILGNHGLLTIENIDHWLSVLFQSDRTQRYWKNEDIRSAELMKIMARHDPDMVCTAFRDLFDESRGLEGRVDRFKFYMDELIMRLRRNSRSFLESWHHQDNSIVSYYLMIQYPQQYIYYTQELHQTVVNRLGAKPLEETEDIVRYQKMAKTISTFLFRNEALVRNHLSRFTEEILPDSQLLVFEYFQFLKR